MSGRTGPLVIFGMLNDPCTNRIEFDVPHGISKVIGIQYARKETPLPKMANGTISPIEIRSVSAMSIPDCCGQRILIFRHSHQMDVICHQNIGPDTKSVTLGIFAEQTHVDFTISRSLSGIGSLEARINNLRAIPGL